MYTLEGDRREGRHGDLALAPPWWEFFNFQLKEPPLIDSDKSIFGAIFEYKDPSSDPYIPKCVIAFRGTVIKPDTALRDFVLNCKCFLNELHKSTRFELAAKCVEDTASSEGASKVWLVGHSLGSAIALLAGKNMVKDEDDGCFLNTYLFNPPFLSIPIDMWFKGKAKSVVRLSVCAARATISIVRDGLQAHDSPVKRSHDWVPHLFVNEGDPICNGYIGHFRRKRYMAKLGLGNIERRAASISLRSLHSGTEALHYIPSADLITKKDQLQDDQGVFRNYKRAHGLEQWWNLNI